MQSSFNKTDHNSLHKMVDCTEDYKILIGSHDKHFYCLNSDGTLHWRVHTDSAVYSTAFGLVPVQPCNTNISENQAEIAASTKRSFTDTNTLDNFSQWKVCSKCHSISSHCVVASTKGTISVFNINTGKIEDRVSVPGEVFSSAVVVNDLLIVGCRDDFIYCFKLVAES